MKWREVKCMGAWEHRTDPDGYRIVEIADGLFRTLRWIEENDSERLLGDCNSLAEAKAKCEAEYQREVHA